MSKKTPLIPHSILFGWCASMWYHWDYSFSWHSSKVAVYQGWVTSGFFRNSRFFFFYFCGKTAWARRVDCFFYRGKMTIWTMIWHFCRPATHTDFIGISRFFTTNLEVSRFPDSTCKIPGFCFVSKLEKQRGVSLCRMSHVSKPTKRGLKINFMIGWIDGLGWILCTPWLSEGGRLGVAHH